MVPTKHGEFVRPTPEQTARLLLESARQDPSLLGRTHLKGRREVAERPLTMRSGFDGLLPVQLDSKVTGANQQFEDLVSIAVASAQQAEDAIREAREVTVAARRSMVMFAGVGLLGMFVGVTAIADHHFLGPGSSVVAAAATTAPAAAPADTAAATTGPTPAPADAGPPSGMMIAQSPAVTQEASGSDNANTAPALTATDSGLVLPAVSAPAAKRPMAPPVYRPPPASDLAPWPPGPPARPTRYYRDYRGASNERVVYPGFIASLRRDLNTLFRGVSPNS